MVWCDEDELFVLLGVACPPAIHRVWPASRGFTVVCGAQALWKCWRICCADLVLFLAGGSARCHSMGRSSRYRRRLGNLRSDLYCHRSSAHALRPSRSHSLELAQDPAARPIVGPSRRVRVLACHSSAVDLGLHALRGSHPADGSTHHLGSGDNPWGAAAICSVCVSHNSSVAGASSCAISASEVASFRHARRVPAGLSATGTRRPVAAVDASSFAHHLSELAEGTILRQYNATPGGIALLDSWTRRTAFRCGTIPVVDSISICICCWNHGGFARDAAAKCGSGVYLGRFVGERAGEPGATGTSRLAGHAICLATCRFGTFVSLARRLSQPIFARWERRAFIVLLLPRSAALAGIADFTQPPRDSAFLM